MKPLTLKEFAEELRRKGDWREADFGDEILALLDLEDEVAEPYSDILADLERRAEHFSNPDDPIKAVEWLGDRSDMLAEIEEELDKDGRTGDTDDQVKALLETYANIRNIIGAPDTATDEDVENVVQALTERVPAMEYDL